MEIKISFGTGKKVIATFDDIKVDTDQPKDNGGEGYEPSPFDLFLVSIGTCTGATIKSFCTHRNIPFDGIQLIQKINFDETTHLVSSISIDIELPSDFPEKYKDALLKSADLCTVKRQLHNPPRIIVTSKMRNVKSK